MSTDFDTAFGIVVSLPPSVDSTYYNHVTGEMQCNLTVRFMGLIEDCQDYAAEKGGHIVRLNTDTKSERKRIAELAEE